MILLSLSLLPAINRPNSIASRNSSQSYCRRLDLDNFSKYGNYRIYRKSSLSHSYPVIFVRKGYLFTIQIKATAGRPVKTKDQ